MLEPETVVRQLWDAINARDYSRLAGAIAEHCDWVSIPSERNHSARRRWSTACARFHEEFPDGHGEIVELLPHGEVVVVEWRMAGTNTGPLNGAPPTGRAFSRRGCSVATVRGGKIVAYRDYFDDSRCSSRQPRRMKLHGYEWGDPAAPPVVCLHGVTAHGQRFKQLAEERWASHSTRRARPARARALGLGSRRGRSPTHVDDLIETFDDLGAVDWVGHSFGGRLVLELAAAHPERIRRAVLLDPAIHVLPQIAALAEQERAEPVYDSLEAYAAARDDAGDARGRARRHGAALRPSPDGRLRRRTCQPAIVSIYGELATEPPPPETLRADAAALRARVRARARRAARGLRATACQIVAVPGMHMVMWEAFDEVADAVDASCRDPRAER